MDVARALLGGGAGIARDVQEAHRWLRTAAEAGNLLARYQLLEPTTVVRSVSYELVAYGGMHA